MNAHFLPSEWEFQAEAGPDFTLRFRSAVQIAHGWIVEVLASDLAPLAAAPDAARKLQARRGYLRGSQANRCLADILRDRPTDFGAVGHIVLGAAAAELVNNRPGGFAEALHVSGAECIDGFQRLKIIAEMAQSPTPERLAWSTVRVEIVCGPARAQARHLYDTADGCLNSVAAQDRLIRCPHIRRLMDMDWERQGYFDPRRGATAGPQGRIFSMADVTRGLACLSASPRPDAANLVVDDEGLEALWSDISSPLYLGLFHDRMSPVGVMRAVEARRAARAALDSLPKRRREGPGHLIAYAPDLICWFACHEVLPVEGLHDEGTDYPWGQVINDQLPTVTLRVADDLVARYQAVREALETPKHSSYKSDASELAMWLEVIHHGGM
ncbi:hypothetical protein ACGFW5_30385 [Streptomyces sp. NPDC048416]|uniref:hypothetical protein n=1 Tax=Streptomyces sp. NPDC048416 TaxID=3365546 RepID=UPI003717BFCA